MRLLYLILAVTAAGLAAADKSTTETPKEKTDATTTEKSKVDVVNLDYYDIPEFTPEQKGEKKKSATKAPKSANKSSKSANESHSLSGKKAEDIPPPPPPPSDLTPRATNKQVTKATKGPKVATKGPKVAKKGPKGPLRKPLKRPRKPAAEPRNDVKRWASV